MFRAIFGNSRKQECIQKNLAPILKTLAYNFFSATYHQLNTFKTQNQIAVISEETEALAAASEEMSSSIEELTSTTQHSHGENLKVEGAVQTGQQSLNQAVNILEEAGRAMGFLADTVRTLEGRVRAIHEAVEVITEITEQTNLLALNASIEAARAGESGRGFAVVAEEIRKLADRTKGSAAQIKEVIGYLQIGMIDTLSSMEQSSKSMEAGIASAQSVTNPFQDIAAATQKVSLLLEQLTGAAQEQTAVTEEMSANAARIAAATKFAEELDQDAQYQKKFSHQITAPVWEDLKKNVNLEQAGLASFLADRVVDHAHWIDKVVLNLRGQTHDTELADHHHCKLGQWYYGEGAQAIHKYPPAVQTLFQKVEEPHRLVHQYGLAAIRYHQQGNRQMAFSSVNDLTNASKEIIKLLMELIDKVILAEHK